MKKKIILVTFITIIAATVVLPQQKNPDPIPMLIDVGHFHLAMNKLNGEGGLQSQFSWMLTGSNPQKTEIFYWPQDQWQSNILYQIFNPISLDDNGIIDEFGNKHSQFTRGETIVNGGQTDWAFEVRRYAPPKITVDGIVVTPPYRWYVDRNLKSDLKIEFEDVLSQFGIRSHVEIHAFSNQDHGDYLIWKATHKFTGEIKRPRESTTSRDTLPDQTIRIWWPISLSFGPSKAGERHVMGGFSYEGEDDLDSWFKKTSQLVTTRARKDLHVAYYWDDDYPPASDYPTVGSSDDTGDPDRVTGYLHSTQIPGFALLHADKSATDKGDDITQPYSMPHASIVLDLWGRRDDQLKLTYRGDDGRGRFPLDVITSGLDTRPQKGTMRFITCGPYALTKNATTKQFDSVTFVYAIGCGGASRKDADSIGRLWFNKQITDQQKKDFVLKGKDSLWSVFERAYWAYDRLERGLPIPAPPPPPDIEVTSGPDRNEVKWSYTDASYFLDANTKVDDWYAWRVYRKQGAYLVVDPLDQRNGADWELVFETTNRSTTTFIDQSVTRGVDYYYAVTAVDNGTQNSYDIVPNQKLESSRFVTRSQLPVVPFKGGLNVSGQTRVVPNPATIGAGGMGFPGTPDRILFVGLPYKCTLKIYTETGDLVETINHKGTADHAWNQRTLDNQYVVSGIYILVVTDSEDVNGKKLDSQIVKFVIIR